MEDGTNRHPDEGTDVRGDTTRLSERDVERPASGFLMQSLTSGYVEHGVADPSAPWNPGITIPALARAAGYSPRDCERILGAAERQLREGGERSN